jgi:hypothetical protein
MDFNFKDLGNMAKLAGEAKQLQEKQERIQHEQIDLLRKIYNKLEEILCELKKNT